MSFGIIALGSGSSGNSFLVHSDEGSILIDAGFSRKELLRRLAEVNIDPLSISAVLLSHEHDDHVKGCRVFCDQFQIPLCLSFETWQYLVKKKNKRLPQNIHRFSPGDKFTLAGMEILPFTVQHDAIDPVGFIIHYKDYKLGFASDLGAVNSLAKLRLADSDILVLEANYDLGMLRRSERQIHLKKRIAGAHGHLNNIDAIDALDELLTERSKVLLMVHASSECNDYELVQTLVMEKLQNMNRDDIVLGIVKQKETLADISLPI